MLTWIALVRGVNVGGGNRLAMHDLRASITSLGYERVATYIQSGNVVFDGGDDEATTAARIRSVLLERHDLTVPVIVRTPGQIARALDAHPDAGGDVEPRLLHVAFLDRAPPTAPMPATDRSGTDRLDPDRWDPDRWDPDRWHLDGRELYLTYPNGSARSKMKIEEFERAWSLSATARNLNTVAKLVEVAASRG